MEITRFDTSNLIRNKSPRIPVCIAIETSQAVWGDIMLKKELHDGIKAFIEYIRKRESSVDLCIFCYSEKTSKVLGFTNITDIAGNETKSTNPYNLVPLEGKPDLNNLFGEVVKAIRLRLNDYNAVKLRSYSAQIIVIGTGKSSAPAGSELKEIRHWEELGTAKVIPVIIGDGPEEFFCNATYDKVVYHIGSGHESLNMEQLFISFGESIERLSESTAEACRSLKDYLFRDRM